MSATAAAHNNIMWYYCDPGVVPGPPYAPALILGPFGGVEMLGKFQRGEFYEYTLMRREFDEVFVTRFHMEMLYAGIPFIDLPPGDLIPPPILRNPGRASSVAYINTETWTRVDGIVTGQGLVQSVGNEGGHHGAPAPEVGQVEFSYQQLSDDSDNSDYSEQVEAIERNDSFITPETSGSQRSFNGDSGYRTTHVEQLSPPWPDMNNVASGSGAGQGSRQQQSRFVRRLDFELPVVDLSNSDSSSISVASMPPMPRPMSRTRRERRMTSDDDDDDDYVPPRYAATFNMTLRPELDGGSRGNENPLNVSRTRSGKIFKRATYRRSI